MKIEQLTRLAAQAGEDRFAEFLSRVTPQDRDRLAERAPVQIVIDERGRFAVKKEGK